jgi:hypothetical protein
LGSSNVESTYPRSQYVMIISPPCPNLEGKWTNTQTTSSFTVGVCLKVIFENKQTRNVGMHTFWVSAIFSSDMVNDLKMLTDRNNSTVKSTTYNLARVSCLYVTGLAKESCGLKTTKRGRSMHGNTRSGSVPKGLMGWAWKLTRQTVYNIT